MKLLNFLLEIKVKVWDVIKTSAVIQVFIIIASSFKYSLHQKNFVMMIFLHDGLVHNNMQIA